MKTKECNELKVEVKLNMPVNTTFNFFNHFRLNVDCCHTDGFCVSRDVQTDSH